MPVGTNDYIKEIIQENLAGSYQVVEVVSNPEFLREGSSVLDAFNGDRIVIGADSEEAASLIEEINQPFGISIYKTDIRSAEIIKYASNAFLATTISFINEISNHCDRLGANVEDVAVGMGMDGRIGAQFLKAGISYGGSCCPKDTEALLKIAETAGMEFELVQSVMNINKKQQLVTNRIAKEVLGSFKGKKIALLGLTFKPNTDDMRESPAFAIIGSY